MKTPLLAITLSAILGGCAGFDAVQGQIGAQGARAADEARQSAEWALCQGITVGAWRRAYGADPARAQGWALLCAPPAAMPLPQARPLHPAEGLQKWTM